MNRFVFISFGILCLAGLPMCTFGQAPTTSYLIPDIGTTGMNSYIEIIAPYNANGGFGSDGLYGNNSGDAVRVVCANPGDTSKIMIGPVVVSWQGRVISTQIFIAACETPNSSDWQSLDPSYAIPLEVIANGVASNTDTFFIVKPFPALNVSGGGVIGSGGQWGTRSKRGAILFDSISLGSGTYTISTADCDPSTIGIQGYLPAVIFSKGNITLSSGAILSGSAIGKNGGPGGGGGSMGDGPVIDSGGFGFVGGSPGESVGVCPATGGIGTGGIGDMNGGGIGLNGIITEPSDVPNCEYYGGTGNPFVSSGGGILDHNKHEGDGNGGGFGTAGENGRGENGYTPDLGGVVNGNSMLVPLMGGSGGGGGNEFCTCDEDFSSPGAAAGGGGGGVCIFAPQINATSGSFQVNGASGATGGVGCVGHGSVGGCGSGGGATIEAKLSSGFPSVSAAGGISLHTHMWPGTGGAGRVRLDGPMSNNPSVLSDSATTYRGLSTDTSSTSSGTISLTGTGNGNPILLYSKSGSGAWQSLDTVSNYANNQWSQTLDIDPSTTTYIVALQQVSNPSTNSATLEPSWVMSQAATNIINISSGPVALILSTPLTSFTQNECGIPIDTSIPLAILGCGSPTGTLDSLWISGSSSFMISDFRTAPRTLATSDSILVSYDGTHLTDSAQLHIRYELGSVIHDTIVELIGIVTSPFLTQPAQIHREAASAYLGQIDSLTLTVDISTEINLDSLWPYITEIQATYSWDSSVAKYYNYLAPSGWSLTSLASHGNAANIDIQNSGSTATKPLDLGTALFRPASTQLATSWVELPNLVIDVGTQSFSLCVTDNEDNHWAIKTLGTLSGVAEPTPLSEGDGISIYPNPAEDELFVQNTNESGTQIVIYDAIGRSVVTGNVLSSSTTSIDIASLARGSYVLVCHIGDRMITRRISKIQ
jgi:Secretion system C-terminal sorting domain